LSLIYLNSQFPQMDSIGISSSPIIIPNFRIFFLEKNSLNLLNLLLKFSSAVKDRYASSILYVLACHQQNN
jgi:hypothetical protein